MPSRKRTKGKERKAKKAEVAAESHRRKWLGWALGYDIDKKKVVYCDHGCNITIPDDAHPVSKFLDTYFSTGDLENVFQTHTQLRKNDSDRNLTINLLESVAMTNLIHPEDGHVAFVVNIAFAIVVLENCDETDDFYSVLCKQAVATKVRDFIYGYVDNERDLLKFFHKRTACSCLKERYSVVRKIFPKLGKCSHCKVVKARSLLMVCGRCKIDQYCSSECHVAAWSEHRRQCGDYINAYST